MPFILPDFLRIKAKASSCFGYAMETHERALDATRPGALLLLKYNQEHQNNYPNAQIHSHNIKLYFSLLIPTAPTIIPSLQPNINFPN